jgi:hypothetical protein
MAGLRGEGGKKERGKAAASDEKKTGGRRGHPFRSPAGLARVGK